MAKQRFLVDLLTSLGTWTAADAVALFPAANLGHPHLSRKAKTGGTTTDQWWKVRLPDGAAAIAAFALLGHDLDGTETGLKIQGNASDAWADPAFSLDVTYRAGALVEWFSQAQTYEWWRFAFTTAAAANVRTAARLLLGAKHEVARNPRPDAVKWGFDTTTRAASTHGGQTFAAVGARLKTFRAVYELAPAAQADFFEALAADCGLHRPFLMSMNHDTDPVAGLLYGRLDKLCGREQPEVADGSTRYRLALEMVEEL